MKLTTVSYRYEERRSANYQSVGVTLEATVAIDEGDDKVQVVAALRNFLKTCVRRDADLAIAELVGMPVAITG